MFDLLSTVPDGKRITAQFPEFSTLPTAAVVRELENLTLKDPELGAIGSQIRRQFEDVHGDLRDGRRDEAFKVFPELTASLIRCREIFEEARQKP
jgi:hypothetical protein